MHRPAVDELTSHEVLASLLAVVEYLDDVLVLQACRRLNLVEKTLDEVRIRSQMLVHDLQGHDAIQPLIVRQKDGGHAPATDCFFNEVRPKRLEGLATANQRGSSLVCAIVRQVVSRRL